MQEVSEAAGGGSVNLLVERDDNLRMRRGEIGELVRVGDEVEELGCVRRIKGGIEAMAKRHELVSATHDAEGAGVAHV